MATDDLNHDGADFKKFRQAMGWTIEKTALAFGKSYRTIQRYERGTQPIPADVRLACCFLAVESVIPAGKARKALFAFRRQHGLKGFVI